MTRAEEEIRAADQAEVRAILHGDPELQARIWGEDFVVTNTEGQVFTRRQVMGVFERGFQPYASFERTTERVRAYGEVAVSMGSERVVATGAPADEAVDRRFTHVWVRRDGAWELVARHAGLAHDGGEPPVQAKVSPGTADHYIGHEEG